MPIDGHVKDRQDNVFVLWNCSTHLSSLAPSHQIPVSMASVTVITKNAHTRFLEHLLNGGPVPEGTTGLSRSALVLNSFGFSLGWDFQVTG